MLPAGRGSDVVDTVSAVLEIVRTKRWGIGGVLADGVLKDVKAKLTVSKYI